METTFPQQVVFALFRDRHQGEAEVRIEHRPEGAESP